MDRFGSAQMFDLSQYSPDDQVLLDMEGDLAGNDGGLSESSQELQWQQNGSGTGWDINDHLDETDLNMSEDQLLKIIYQNAPAETHGVEPIEDASLYHNVNNLAPATVPVGSIVKNDAPLPSIFLPTVPSTSAEKPRNSRKATHHPMQFSPPTYEESYANSPSPAVTVKVEPTSPPVAETGRRRKMSSTTNGVAIKSEPCHGGKRQKLYELDTPQAKNAKAAKANREKKKNELNQMKIQNEILRKEKEVQEKKIHDMQLKAKEMEKQLALQTQKSQALSGLARVSQSAKSLLETMLEGFKGKFGDIYSVEVPEWFHQAPANLEGLQGTEKFLTQGETSSFITFHVSKQAKTIRVDYNPGEPIVSNCIPGMQ